MNYPPKHHQENNYNNVINVIKQYPFATLITVKNNMPFITHIPLVFEREHDSTLGKLVGHIDKYNPQVATLTDGAEATAIFYGPDCYISPSVYSTKQLPTWNYIIAHVKGTITRYTDLKKVKQTMLNMTSFLEAPEHKFKLTPDNPKMDAALPYIVGFEIAITQWEGKFKLSQDKLKTDQELAKKALIKSQKKDISAFINALYEAHNQR